MCNVPFWYRVSSCITLIILVIMMVYLGSSSNYHKKKVSKFNKNKYCTSSTSTSPSRHCKFLRQAGKLPELSNAIIMYWISPIWPIHCCMDPSYIHFYILFFLTLIPISWSLKNKSLKKKLSHKSTCKLAIVKFLFLLKVSIFKSRRHKICMPLFPA